MNPIEKLEELIKRNMQEIKEIHQDMKSFRSGKLTIEEFNRKLKTYNQKHRDSQQMFKSIRRELVDE